MRLALREVDAPVWGLWPAWVRLAGRVLQERGLWMALGVGLLAMVVAYQRPVFVDVGPEVDNLYTSGFHEAEQSGQANFRWTKADSTLVFRGVGKPLSAFAVRLQMSSGSRPQAVEIGVAVNGHDITPIQVKSGSAAYTVTVDPAWVDASGDVSIRITTPVFRSAGDKRELGVIVDFARLDMPVGAVLPSLTQVLWLLLSAVLLYLISRGAWLAPGAAGLVTLLFLFGCAGVVAVQRLLLTTFTERLAVTMALALLVGTLGEMAVRWATKAAGWRGGNALPEWAWAGLRGLIMATVALKVGGLLHPYSFIIDAPFHYKYITFMAEGKPWEYFGESLARAVMPKEEWGDATAFIPYSPFFYVVAAPLAWLPVPLSLSVPVASGVFEALKVGLVFVTGLAFSRTRLVTSAGRSALAAAAVYAAIPATFLLQQWGNWPTQLSLWLLALWVAVTALFWKRITALAVWLASTAALTLTMLSYTVTAVYTGIFVGLLVALGWVLVVKERRRWGAVAGSLVAATALALLLYYGQYVGRIVGETLPTFGQAIEHQGKLTTLRPTFWGFVTGNLADAMQSYQLAIIYGIGLAGALWLFVGGREVSLPLRRRETYGLVTDRLRSASSRRDRGSRFRVEASAVWLGAWLMTFPLFTLADFWVDQALKEFWFALPAVAVVAGGWMLAVRWKGIGSRWGRVLVWVLAATLVWQSLSLWVFRLFFHNR